MNDKEKLEKALVHLKKFIDGDCVCDSDILADFPELAESEDERIKKAILSALRGGIDTEKYLEKHGTNYGEVQAWLERQKERFLEPHNQSGDPYDMPFPDAQEYIQKRGFDLPWHDGDVFVDTDHITQTVANILRWADEHPKEQKPAEKQDYSGLTDFERAIHRGFLCAGVENVPVTIIKETAQDCLAQQKAEWSIEDKACQDTILCAVQGKFVTEAT